MAKDTWRIVTRGQDGELIIHDFDSPEAILRTHLQVGTDDCSTDLALRGAPIFRSDRKSTRLNSSHEWISRMPSSA